MDDCACAEMITAAGGASCETVGAATAIVIVFFGSLPIISFGGRLHLRLAAVGSQCCGEGLIGIVYAESFQRHIQCECILLHPPHFRVCNAKPG